MRSVVLVMFCVIFTGCICVSEAQAFRDGYIYGIDNEDDRTKHGWFWRMNLETGVYEEISRFSYLEYDSYGTIDSRNDVYCFLAAVRNENARVANLATLDLETGELRNRFEPEISDPRGLIFSPVDGFVYVIERVNNNEARLIRMDAANGSIIRFDPFVVDIQPHCAGMLDYTRGHYHHVGANSVTTVIDITTGQVVESYTPEFEVWAARFDPVSGLFYGLNDRLGHDLVALDPVTKEVKVVAANMLEFRGHMCGGGLDVNRRWFLQSTGVAFRIFNLEGELLRAIGTGRPWEILRWNVYTPMFGDEPHAGISGSVTADLNNNCARDDQDAQIGYHEVLIRPGNRRVYTNRDGEFNAYLPVGEYELIADQQDLWQSSCVNNPAKITLEADQPVLNDLDFLLEPQRLVKQLDVSISSSRAAVGRGIIYYIQLRNSGSLPYSGVVSFEHDPLLTGFRSTPEANRYDDSKAEWQLEDVPIGGTLKLTATLRVPPDEELLGEIICARVQLQKGGGSDLLRKYDRDETCTEILAPFDPNDISVAPRGFGESGLISAADSTLAYTIRFQNIGNVPAQDVVILDTLDRDLDINTIHFGAASHEYSVSVLNDHILEFRFEGIMLPGQDVDEVGSKGVVKYKIDLNKGLAIDTEIHNRAAIYFDFNKAVLTNTVVNTLGEHPTDVVDRSDADELELRSLDHGLFVLHSDRMLDGRLAVYSLLGTRVFEQDLEHVDRVMVDLGSQRSGTYYLRLETDSRIVTRRLVVVR